MAMTITLRDRIGNEILQREISKRAAYPEIILSDDKSYVIKQVSRDKKTALYVEASVFDLTEA